MGRLSPYSFISLTVFLCFLYHFGDCRKMNSQVENRSYSTKQTLCHTELDAHVGQVEGGDSLWAAL